MAVNPTAGRRVERDEMSTLQAENTQLKATIVALREELEQARLDKETSVQQALAMNIDEIQQLRASVAGLREALEAKDATYLDRIQVIERQSRDEARHLQETIRLLRQQLEERHA